jgi:3-hydroxybutyryl-CoA dehydratase
MRGEQEVLDRRGGGRELLDLGDLRMIRVEHGDGEHDHGRPQGRLALAGELGRIEVGLVLGEATSEELAERAPRFALDQEKPPGPQPTVVRSRRGGGEHPLERRLVGPRSGHPRRWHGPPPEQSLERVQPSSTAVVNRHLNDRRAGSARASASLPGLFAEGPCRPRPLPRRRPAASPALAPAPQQSHAAARERTGRTPPAIGVGPMEHGLYLEDLQPGMSAVFGKTITDADILMFAGVSGDTNPVHLNEEFAGGTVFKGRIAHGLLTASLISTAIGTKLPGPGAVYLSQTMKFLAPVRAGDTVRAIVTVKSVDLERRRVTMDTVCKVGSKEVLVGEAVIMVPRRPQQEQAAAE